MNYLKNRRKPRQIYPFHKGDKLDKITILEDDFEFYQDRYQVKYQCECGRIEYRRLDKLLKLPFKCCKSCCSTIHYPEHRKKRNLFDDNGINYSWLNYIKSKDNLNRGGKIIECNITTEDMYNALVKQNNKCAYTGEELKVINTFKYESNASLDRIDSSKGYTKDNIQWVLKEINVMKNDFTHDDFVYLCNKISNYLQGNSEPSQSLTTLEGATTND